MWKFLMLPYPLTNLQIKKWYENEPKFKGVYSRNNSSKIKDGAYIINLDLYVNARSVTYFDSFGVEQEKLEKPIENKNIVTNIFRNTSIWFDNMQILLHWTYWFHVKGQRFIRVNKFIFFWWI